MRKHSKHFSHLVGFIALQLMVLCPAHATDILSIPTQKNEDLLTALRRVHPCFDSTDVKIPAQIFTDNPEHVGRGGGMVLANPVLRVPAPFLDAKTQCAPQARAPIQETRKFRGGPEITPAHDEAAPAQPERKDAKDSTEERNEATEKHEENPYKNHLTLLGLLDYSRMAATITSTSAMPIFVSNPQPGFELLYSRELSPKWSVGFNYVILNTSFQDISGLPFTELTNTLQEFAFSARYRITHSSRISLQIGGAQVDELSISPVDGSLLIDHTFRITGTALFWQELGRVAGMEVLAGLGVQTFVPTDWSVDSVGVGEIFRLLLERDLSPAGRSETGMLGSYERQETQSESHSELSIAFGLGLASAFSGVPPQYRCGMEQSSGIGLSETTCTAVPESVTNSCT